MIGFLLYKHFSFNNINSLCGKLKWVELSFDRQRCYQCKAILINPCDHDDYYCLKCLNKDFEVTREFITDGEKRESSIWVSRRCYRHIKLISVNAFFNVYKSCLKCYRELTKNWTDRNMLMPADFSKYLPL